MQFGTYIIGDEILSGKRQDAHLSAIIRALNSRGLTLSWAHYMGDDFDEITRQLKESMARGDIVFCFGGIGATPDDFTRQAAAAATGVPVERHAEAIAEIEAHFGESAYPKRVLMAEFPKGATLIPNPVNRVAGFAINRHYFMPGFPQMAHPMMEWVLDTHYPHLFNRSDYSESSILVMDAGESRLIDLMQEIVSRFPAVRIFSLPKLDARRTIELGVKGPVAEVDTAMQAIRVGVSAAGFPWEPLA